MNTDRIAAYYAHGGGQSGHGVTAVKGWQLSNGVYPIGKGWPNAPTIPMRDAFGRTHLVTEKQQRIYIALLELIRINHTSTSFRTIAASLGVCVTTVSNMARKLMAWGLLGYLSSRGRYGGVTLFARSKGDGLDRFARMAAQAVREWWQRRTDGIRARSNVHSSTDRVSGYHLPPYISSGVDIRNRRSERDDRIEQFLMSMQKGSLKRVPCPAHGGKDANVSFWRRPDGSLGTKCWSHQCTERAIKDAVEAWG